ncbi:hypothetical protein DE146DRAFT_43395 [Phaeosphaeria sp. MPI-PUGE-AT-0046c]|nr:hypothetical protein DE146DRAFT_43395 [Phaeosphaeria sp. MPI-PUGE-AT-0046c]
MTVFATKDAFFGLGLEKVEPSSAHISQDCSVCTKPLAVHHKDSSPQLALRGLHKAVRITACGHMHGSDCLLAWLSTGNSCPTCRRILFEANNDTITQDDANEVVHVLGPHFGEARVMVAIAKMMQNEEKEHVDARRYHDQEVAKQRMEDSKADDGEFTLGADDFYDSGDEMNYDEDADEDADDEYFDNGDVE